MTHSIYLDNNATTKMLPEVATAMATSLAAGYLNPSSQHSSGRRARNVIETAREGIAKLLGASLYAPNQDSLVFTSGATEANNLAIRGLVSQPGTVLVSAIEHPSVLAACDTLKTIGCDVKEIPVTDSGHVSVDDVRKSLTFDTRLVVIMLGNNEIGTLQPISEISDLCAEKRVPLHCDGVQAIGKIPVNFAELGVSTLAFSAHKFHGPRGIGGLLIRHHVTVAPLIVGGAQQLGIRPGTEAVASAVGMHTALKLVDADAQDQAIRMTLLRDRLWTALSADKKCALNGGPPWLPHTLNVSFCGIDRQALVMALDLAGVECSTGSACTSGSSEPSHVLLAMKASEARVYSSIRFSVSRLTTESEIDSASDRILNAINKLRNQ